jgi:hypothetical protein
MFLALSLERQRLGGKNMSEFTHRSEPLCATSEKCERKLIPQNELQQITADIGRRIVEAFDYRSDYEIAVILKTSRKAVECLTTGDRLPDVETLLLIHKATGVSLDWLLTGDRPQPSGRPLLPAVAEEIAVYGLS